MKYLKVFETQAEESAWKESEEYIKTSLSMDKENMDELSYNSKVKFRAEYDLSGLEGDVKLTNCGNIFDSLKVNGVEAVTGSVEATREEVKVGITNDMTNFEVTIPKGTYTFEGGSLQHESIWLPYNKLIESTIEIEDVNNEGFSSAIIVTYNPTTTEYGLDEITLVVKDPSVPNVYIIDIDSRMNVVQQVGLLNTYVTILLSSDSSSDEKQLETKIRGQYINHEDVVDQVMTITKDDLICENNAAIFTNLNGNSIKDTFVDKCYISYEGEYTDLYLLITSSRVMDVYIFSHIFQSVTDLISNEVITHVSGNTYELNMNYNSSELKSRTPLSVCFVNGDDFTQLDNYIPTTITYSGRKVNENTFNNNEYMFNSVESMRSAQIYIPYDTDIRFYTFALHPLSTLNAPEGNFGTHYIYNFSLGSEKETVPLTSLGDNLYAFPEEWISAAEPYFTSNDKVVFCASYFYYASMDMYAAITFQSLMFNYVLSVKYSIIQETTSGGAPKELSVDASVGKVSLIGEVNDYFSTLPSSGFEGCPLETVIIPDNVKSIGTKCFGHCDRLKKVYLPQNMDKLADYAFGGNSVKRGNVVNIRSVKDESPLAFGDYGGKVELYEWVDLGLPSGLKWAAWNVGATKPEEFGLYFAWGETQGYTGITATKQFSWADYTLCDGTENNMTKYNETDGLTTLEASDDVVTVTDSSCRMPTEVEMSELTANTTSEWVDDYNGTGVAGRIFTSNVNGNSIFVPSAGLCFNGSVFNIGQYGYLWSSSLSSTYVNSANLLDFTSSLVDVGSLNRFGGLPVRAVKE